MLNEIWSRVKEIEEIVKEVNERYKELYENEHWKPELISKYDVERLINEAKESLVRKAVSLTLEKHGIRNIKIPESVFREFSEKEFDENEISECITKNYVEKAEEIAYKQILSKAKELLPTIWNENGRRKPRIDEIVKGRKLFLRVYWTWGSIDYKSLEEISALGKLIRIVLLKEEASKTDSRMVMAIDSFRSHEDYSQARSYYYDNGIIKSFRIYKNGKFEVEFHKKSYAEEVAKALLS